MNGRLAKALRKDALKLEKLGIMRHPDGTRMGWRQIHRKLKKARRGPKGDS